MVAQSHILLSGFQSGVQGQALLPLSPKVGGPLNSHSVCLICMLAEPEAPLFLDLRTLPQIQKDVTVASLDHTCHAMSDNCIRQVENAYDGDPTGGADSIP